MIGSVATDCGFKVYYSDPMGGSYALIIVTDCHGVDGSDFLEYHVCVSSVSGSSLSGKLTREEIFASDPGADVTSLSLADLGKIAAEAALSRFLLERRSATKNSPLDPANLWLQEGTPADLYTIGLQRTFAQFLTDTQTRTSCPRLQGFLKRISSMSSGSRASGV